MKQKLAILLFLLGTPLFTACENEEAPTIPWWSVRPHADRGVCTRCHTRVDNRGNLVPTITSASRMPHMDRGVCQNCHVIVIR